jgi:hypothetical protein
MSVGGSTIGTQGCEALHGGVVPRLPWLEALRSGGLPVPGALPGAQDQSHDVSVGFVGYNARPGLTLIETAQSLGFLADLVGTWKGKGFNVVVLPVYESDPIHGGKLFRLMLNSTQETLEFHPIGGPVPNRGYEKQPDINLFGLTYLQEINDVETGMELHVEPGFWLNVPSTTVPELPATVVRQGVIPHGNSMLALGTAREEPSRPTIGDVDSTPISREEKPEDRDLGHEYMEPFENSPLPPGFKLPFVKNPNLAPPCWLIDTSCSGPPRASRAAACPAVQPRIITLGCCAG